ncbi:MAG: energy-coupling factor transporter ATPase [Oscillospiraceae bacterium]|jgi:energy-coupling factor transport system ATP-binding protein|nr:energy-coupling factor transporter ATPase [Oscillospiraceae bacterium]
MIETRALTHTYQPGSPFESVAVYDITLTISDGEFVAFVGATGSGKTTLIQHFNGLLKPTSGWVKIDGINPHEKDAPKGRMRSLRQSVGMVFQYPEHQLFEETVAKDVAFGPRNLGLSELECGARVREAMEKVGLPFETFSERSPFELSGGQMRRAAVAGVLAMRPRALILDEPTAGLDPGGRNDFLNLCAELNRDGVTIALVSHTMEDVARLARRVFVLKKGALARTGAPAELFADTDGLRALGLEPPDMSRLRSILNARGMDIPADALTPEAMAETLARMLNPAYKPEARP